MISNRLTALAALLFAGVAPLFSQKKENGKAEVQYVNISSAGLSVSSATLKFAGKGRISFSGKLKLNFDVSEIEKVTFTLSGKDENGKSISISTSATYNSTSQEYSGSVANENPVYMSSADLTTNVVAARLANPVTVTASVFDQQKTSFAVLLNGQSKDDSDGKCYVFERNNDDEKNEKEKFVKLDTLKVATTITKPSEKRAAIFGVVLGINSTKEKQPDNLSAMIAWGTGSAYVTIIVSDEKGNENSGNLYPVYNVKTGRYEFIGSIELTKVNYEKCAISSLRMNIENNCTRVFSSPGGYLGLERTSQGNIENWLLSQKSKSKEKDNFKTFSYKSFNVDGYNIIQVSLAYDKGSSIAKTMSTNMTILDCNGEKQNISIQMKYNSRTGTWTGSAVLGISKCDAKLAAFTLNWENACGDKRATETVYLSEPSNEWKCEDKCLKSAKGGDNQLCGSTDHF